MASFVRKSKFRHVFGKEAKKDQCYENFRVTNCAFEGNFIAANGKFIAFCVETGGSGTFIVMPVGKQTGRIDPNIPKVTAHKEYVLDMKWNPYNDNMLATCSEDGSIRLWDIPDMGLLSNKEMDSSLLHLDYHQKRCVQLSWHPVVSNVMLSVSQEPKICVWNLDEGTVATEIEDIPDIIYNAEWSQKGDKIVSCCKDKKFRIHNARTGELLVSGQGHEGSKPQRVIFTMNDKFLFSCGFSKMSERQYACWDAETIEELSLEELDTANGTLVPYYDPDTQIVYIAAKGDTVIRYYELVDEDPYFHYITTFQTKDAQRGLGPIPKREMIVNDCEVYRFYKLIQQQTGSVVPVSFTVPRKAEIFQDDLYPDAIGPDAAIEPDEWLSGKDAEPIRFQMQTKFIGKAKPAMASGGLGGGLKKGGLKKKAADAGEQPKKAAEPVKEVKKEPEPKPEPKKPEPKPEPKREPVKEEEPQEKQKKVSELVKEKDEKKSAAKSQPAASEGVNKQEIKELKAIVDDLAKLDEKRAAKMKELERRLAALEAK